MASLSKQRGPGRAFALALAAIIIGWTIYQEYKGHQEVGQIEYRMISGYLNNSFEVIMIETAKQYTVIDPEFKDVFQNNDAEIVTRPEQLQLLQKYKDVQYRVNIKQNEKGENAQYRLSREKFNQIKFNSNIKFEIDRKVKDSIISIVEM